MRIKLMTLTDLSLSLSLATRPAYDALPWSSSSAARPLHQSFLYSQIKLCVHFANRSAAIWFCYVVIHTPATASSASAIRHETHNYKPGNVLLRNTETRSCSHCCRGKAIRITYYEGVFAALGIQHAMRIRHIVIRGLSGSYSIFHIIS